MVLVLLPLPPPHSALPNAVLLYLLQVSPPRLRPLSSRRSATVWLPLVPFRDCPRRCATAAVYPSSMVRDVLLPPAMLPLLSARPAVALFPRPLNCKHRSAGLQMCPR